MPTPLTERQQQVLDCIRAHRHQFGISPTVRELCRATGIGSSCTMQKHISRLCAKGYLTSPGARSRALVPTDELDAVRLTRAEANALALVLAVVIPCIAAGSPRSDQLIELRRRLAAPGYEITPVGLSALGAGENTQEGVAA